MPRNWGLLKNKDGRVRHMVMCISDVTHISPEKYNDSAIASLGIGAVAERKNTFKRRTFFANK